ncbi:MAG: ABC transporter permease [Candidatus Omnitrophota bacterium]
MTVLEGENLCKTYRLGGAEIKALQGVTLRVEQGEFVAVMGPSGSGKSTLMHVLGFLDSPDSGTIRLLGKEMTGLGEEERAYLRNRIIGFVFQQFNLMARSTAIENVLLPLLYSDDPVRRLRRPVGFLKRVGLGDRMRHKPSELSGGQQQRVAIARALVNHPFVLFADEPTGNLDSRSGREVMDILQELHQGGMTVILVTHDEHVAAAAQRIIRMQDGQIVLEERRSKTAPGSFPQEVRFAAERLRRKKYSFREFREHFFQAFRMIASNKLRSCLSMLGVLIGVACVITMLALGRGARESITEQLSRMGSNLIGIRSGSVKVHGVSSEAGATTRFTLDDVAAICETVPGIVRAAPQVQGGAQAVYGNKNWSTRVIGTTPEYAPMKNQEPAMGRFFTEDENRARRRVVLLGETVARELFGEENAIGKTIKLNRIYFQVIGLLPSLGGSTWHDQDDVVVVPLMTAMSRLLGKDYLDQMDVEVATVGQMKDAEESIRNLIIRRHRLTPERYDSFNVRNYTEIQEALSSTTKTFSVLLGAVAAISLVVGGIGIMNIMLVSVKERTREIGLRKAVGATPFDILLQFLVEAVVITFLGGMAGIILAVVISAGIAYFAQWKMVIDLVSLLVAFIFSAAVGVVFGLAPARQAAELDPIEALRYE